MAKAETYGVDLGTHSSKPSSKNASTTTKGCEIASKDLVSQTLGQPIERMEPVKNEPGTCLYFGPAGVAARLAKEATEAAFKRAQQPGSKPEEGVEIVRGITGLAGGAYQTPEGGENPLLIFLISRGDGKPQMTALAVSKGIFGNIPGTVVEVPNLGDRAIQAAGLGLNVLKGDSLMRIIVAPMPGANEKAIALARALLPGI